MLKIAVICIFGLCLLQFAHALPVDKHESSDVAVAQRSAAVDRAKGNSPFEKEVTLRQQLVLTIMVEVTLLSKYAFEEGRVLFQDTLKELNALPDKSEALQANITRLADFVKETKDLDIKKDPNDVEKSLSAMLKMTEILQDYEDMPNDDKLTETLKTAFERAGLKKFEIEFEKRIINFSDNFEEAFKTFLSETYDEMGKNPQLIAWFDKLVAEKNSEKKVEIINELFN